ncbi:hypothetical protein [Actinophytocola sp.]|uniref:hypothetical protein n=1 Tax=Actinophytocola sp. TaxID=1872138 RepID=UPI002D7F41EB|nr:hypothetical protein [Actinophytocola sp.]HET9144077.1 hypothetical protein [Actinophytocola sp.]
MTTTLALLKPGDLVHLVIENPDGDPNPEVCSKLCHETTVADVDPEADTIGLEGGVAAAFDGVSLPKIEAGPSGRELGTFHLPAMCG